MDYQSCNGCSVSPLIYVEYLYNFKYILMVMDANYMCAQFSLAGEGICWTLGKSWVPPIQTGGTELRKFSNITVFFLNDC